MDTTQLLKKFAKTQGIHKKEVNKFLKDLNTPKTLDDVMNLPHDAQTHEEYITWVKEPLQSFIQDRMYINRYETIKVDRVIEKLYDCVCELLEIENIDEIGFENLATDDESKKEELNNLKSIVKCIIDIKFGSVVMDW